MAESDFAGLAYSLSVGGCIVLGYIAIFVEKPIVQPITSIAALVWIGCIALPFLMASLPYLGVIGAVGTATVLAVALFAEWPHDTGRPGPMGA